MKNSSGTSSTSIAHLSEKEKLQYLQLTKTRGKIIDEFSRSTGMSLDSGSIGTGVASKARSGISSHSKIRSKKNSSSVTSLPPLQTGIMMLPILATSGEPAMGGNAGKKLKLPIFKLPSIDPKQFQSEKLKVPVGIIDKTTTLQRFVNYFDKKSFKKAMLGVFRQLPPSEKQFIAHFVSGSDKVVADIGTELERRIEFDNDPTFHNGRKCIFVPTDLFKPEFYFPSVFMTAIAPVDKHFSRIESSSRVTPSTVANLNLESLGMSTEFHNFIGVSAKLDSSNDYVAQTGKIHKRAGDRYHRPKRSKSMHEMSSIELTKMLIDSMSKMDKHSNMIKKGIEEAQEIVDSKDSNVKVVIFSVGAERLQAALYKIVRLELKRGIAAWKIFIEMERRQIIVRRFFRFLVVRNLAIGLGGLVSHVLKTNLSLWKKNADAESKRLLREKVERSAILIQSIMRSRISYKRVSALKQRKKYQKLYDCTIKIQALMRGTVVKWRYQRSRVDRIQRNAAITIQVQIRGALARTRVQQLLILHRRNLASKDIQRIVRGILGRRRVAQLRILRNMNTSAVLIQKIIRGFVDRRTMTTKRINKMRFKYAVKIQALVRGFITRVNMERKLADLQAHRDIRIHAVVQIQAAYRGFHARLLFRMKLYQLRKVKAEQFKAATSIITMVRGFLCRAELRNLKASRMEKWISDAREWQEMWSDESSAWFYLHTSTGEAIWEPNSSGYTKFDGSLVLASGEIISDPRYAKLEIEDGAEEEATESPSPKNAKNHKLCSECIDRVAIRSCNECGDKFCTKCYKSTHGTGSRRNHTYSNIGPIDCAECELLLAGRWCVSCDEAYCNACWKKVHSHGKRRFHPYSEVSANGRIDSRIFTMDGEQLDSYDTSYNQQRSDLEKSTVATSQLVQYDQPSNDLEWTEYADDQGYPYWYNTITGESTYENPYGQLQTYEQY